jgi:uroporphyrinogen III methyltransferase/synthase
VDWSALARTGGTLVFLMAMTRIGEIAAALVAGGMSADTPVAAIRWGTLPRQKKIVSTLARIEADAGAELVRPPVIFVVGAVAALADELGWYEKLPLFGKRVVVTRARRQAAALAERLERAGAEVLEFPTIELTELAIAPEVFDRAGTYDWLVLTSVNGVETFFRQFLAAGRDLRDLAGVKIAAIGSSTKAAVERHGIRVVAQPPEYRAESLLETLGDLNGQRVLLARAEVAREVLPDTLRAQGAVVDVVPIYRTSTPDAATAGELPADFDLITFTSSSTVTGFDRLSGGNAKTALAGKLVAAIGAVTAETATDLGLTVDVMPADSTIEALADAIERFFAIRQALP